jgi:hypothetical protein
MRMASLRKFFGSANFVVFALNSTVDSTFSRPEGILKQEHAP